VFIEISGFQIRHNELPGFPLLSSRKKVPSHNLRKSAKSAAIIPHTKKELPQSTKSTKVFRKKENAFRKINRQSAIIKLTNASLFRIFVLS